MIFIPEPDIKRGIYNALRVEIATQGYYPDLSLISDENALNTAKNSITAGGKELIILYPPLSVPERADLKNNSVFIDWTGTEKGNLKSKGTLEYEPIEVADTLNHYKKKEYPDEPVNIMIEITIVTKTTKYLHIIKRMVEKVFGINSEKDIVSINENGVVGEDFEMSYQNQVVLNLPDFYETKYIYKIKNIFLEDLAGLGDIAPTQDIVNIINIEPTQEVIEDTTFLNIIFQQI